MNEIKEKLIEELIELHKQQRGWQRLVEDERLNMDVINGLSVEQLQEILKKLRNEKGK